MKKIQINHKVEITNNVLGYHYLIFQFTELNTEDIENEHVEVRLYDAKTGHETFKYETKYSLYPAAKKEFKRIILECLPC